MRFHNAQFVLLIILALSESRRSDSIECEISPCLNGGLCAKNENQSYCSCSQGYVGSRCEYRDPCWSNPCHPPARCVSNNVNQYRCICPLGWTGHDCDEDVDECSVTEQSPCEHGGQCLNKLGSYSCSCKPGYKGTRCEQELNECADQPCFNGALCVDEVANYRCECAPGFEGRNCEREINECAESPCANGAQCEDLVGGFQCHCLPGWTGRECKQLITNCTSDPCLNGGVCEDRIGGFQCHCPPGFSGNFCEVSEHHCSVNRPCANGGRCSQLATGWQCLCAPGYAGGFCETATISTAPRLNTEITEMTVYDGASTPSECHCMNGGFCQDGICQCLTGFTGSKCEQTNPCFNHSCVNGVCVPDGTSTDSYTCVCDEGFEGPLCEHNIFGCFSQPCGNYGICLDTVANYSCACLPGAVGDHCEKHQRTDEPNLLNRLPVRLAGHVSAVPSTCPEGACENLAQCESSADSGSNVTCLCNTAVGYFRGERCELDENECDAARASPCLNGAQCINTHGSYFCRCPAGFYGTHCEWQVDPCRQSKYPVCRNGGKCVSHNQSFHCECHDGFSGAFCEIEPDYCTLRPCQNGGLCINLLQSRVCQCPRGFSGTDCGTSTDQCLEHLNCQPKQCQNGGLLIQTAELTYCKCPRGFVGPECEGRLNFCELLKSDVAMIHKEQLDRQLETMSFDRSWSRAMVEDELMWNATAAAILRTSNSSFASMMSDLGQCDLQGTHTCVPWDGEFSCICNPGYGGRRCELLEDKCTAADLANHGQFCLNGGFCEVQITPHPVNSIVQFKETVVCVCPVGFDGPRCEHENRHCIANPCKHGGTCRSRGRGRHDDRVPLEAPYVCQCPPGRAGLHCELDLHNTCEQLLNCQHDASCELVEGIPRCKCSPGFCGSKCEFQGINCMTTNLTSTQPSVTDKHPKESDKCLMENCPSKRANGQCDPECDYLACEFDGLECLFTLTQSLQVPNRLGNNDNNDSSEMLATDVREQLEPAKPWSQCSAAIANRAGCHLRFNDGVCDPECDEESCLFDGWDCERMEPFHEENSTCLEKCTREETFVSCQNYCKHCSPSDRTCFEDQTNQSVLSVNQTLLLDGELVILLNTAPTKLIKFSTPTAKLRSFLEELSGLLHLDVRLETSYPYGGVIPVTLNLSSGIHSEITNRNATILKRVRRSTFQDSFGSRIGSQVHLRLDASSCHRRSKSCFEHVDSAAQFVAATLRHGKHQFLQPILSVQSAGGQRPSGKDRNTPFDWFPLHWSWSASSLGYLCLAVLVVLVFGLLVGVLFATAQQYQLNQQHQHPHGDCASNYRRTLAAYLQRIGQRRRGKKIHYAKIWYPGSVSGTGRKDSSNTLHNSSFRSLNSGAAYRPGVRHIHVKQRYQNDQVKGGLLSYLAANTDLDTLIGFNARPKTAISEQLPTTTCLHTFKRESDHIDPVQPERASLQNFANTGLFSDTPNAISKHPSFSETSVGTCSTLSTKMAFDPETANEPHLDSASGSAQDPKPEWLFQQIVAQLLSGIETENIRVTWINNDDVNTNGTPSSISFYHLLVHLSRLDQRDAVQRSSQRLNVGGHQESRLLQLMDMRLHDTGESLLHLAARFNQPAMVQTLLNSGADPTSVDNAGRTVLLTAVSSGSLESTHVILAHPSAGSNPMCFVPSLLTDSTTPLMQAVKMGDVETFRLLLHSMNVLLCNLAKNNTSITDQSNSVSGLMNLLDLNMADSTGRTVLHWAAVTDQVEMVHRLLEAGASCDAQTIHDETPLVLASKEGALSTCRLLLMAGASQELADYLDRTPRQLAEQNGHEEVVRLLEHFSQTESTTTFLNRNDATWQQPKTFSKAEDSVFVNRDWRTYFNELESKNNKVVSASNVLGQSSTPYGKFSTKQPVSASSSETHKVHSFIAKGSMFSNASKNLNNHTESWAGDQRKPYNQLVTYETYCAQFMPQSMSFTGLLKECGGGIPNRNEGKNPDSFEHQLANSDSESPNRWSSSPSDASPKYARNSNPTLSGMLCKTVNNTPGNHYPGNLMRI